MPTCLRGTLIIVFVPRFTFEALVMNSRQISSLTRRFVPTLRPSTWLTKCAQWLSELAL